MPTRCLGPNEVEGDGVVLEKRGGRRIRQSVHIECASTVDVDETADPPDRFVRGTEVALVKRIMAKDSSGMQLVLCIIVNEVATVEGTASDERHRDLQPGVEIEADARGVRDLADPMWCR